MEAWITWENGLFLLALFVAVRSLVNMMHTMHHDMVTDISAKIETERKRREEENIRLETEQRRAELIRRREEQLERIRNDRHAA